LRKQKRSVPSEKYNRWECREKHDARQFTLKTGTIFEDSPIGLDKWVAAIWMVVNCKNGISSWEMHRSLKVTQKSAWFMNHRIRYALQNGTIMRLDSKINRTIGDAHTKLPAGLHLPDSWKK